MNDVEIRALAIKVATEYAQHRNTGGIFEFADRIVEYITKPQKHDLSLKPSDPIDFLRKTFFLHDPVGGKRLFEPWEHQEKIVEMCEKNDFVTILASRQIGTTSTLLNYALWSAHKHPNISILFTSPKLVTSHIDQRIRCMHKQIPEAMRSNILETLNNQIVLENGSVIVFDSLEEDYYQTFDLVILDNAAYVPHSKGRKWWAAISAMDPSQIIMASSAGVREGIFYDAVNERSPVDFTNMTFTWLVHPDRDFVWADNEKKRIGENRFRREYECHFSDGH